MAVIYPYASKENLQAPASYRYAKFGGVEFLRGYKKNRDRALRDEVDEEEAWSLVSQPRFLDAPFVEGLLPWIIEGEAKERLRILDLWVKSFEIRQHLYAEYELLRSVESGRIERIIPRLSSAYENPWNYILFGFALQKAYRQSASLKYLNALLKLNDLLIPWVDSSSTMSRALGFLLRQELEGIEALARSNGVEWC